ncbi:glycerophosphodiester phosphodiesterase family protein [Citrobacter freundii complex sp. 2025EL-00176]
MTTYNTGNPLGSAAAKDLYDNAENFDYLSNDLSKEIWPDRFGKQRLTWYGMEERYKTALVNLGFNPIGTFQDGAIVTATGDIVQDTRNDTWYRWDDLTTIPKTVPSGSTPESSGGTGEGKWLAVDVSDVLRKDLASPDAGKGASIVVVEGGGTVEEALKDNKNAIRNEIPTTDRRIIINAHRGYSETYIEQTLMAYSQCQTEAFEIDMQTTSDGYAVCFHDDDLSIQTVTGTGAIKDNTMSTISSLRFKRTVGTRYEDMVGIPQLGPVCKIALRRGKKLLAEIKGYRTIDDCALYNQIIGQYGLNSSTTYICFDFAPLQYIRNINGESSFGWVINSYDSTMDQNIETLASWGGGMLGINKSALTSIGNDKLRQWEAMGLTLNSWTIYTPQDLESVLSLGIRNVTIDKEYANILNN